MDHDEHIRLIKENAGLKTGYEKYKRKYKLIRNIVMRELWERIDFLGAQERVHSSVLRNEASSKEQCAVSLAILKKAISEKKALELIYEMCQEIDRI